MTVVDLKMSTFAEAEAQLAKTLPGYEPRQQQTDLAEAVEKAIANRTHLLAEAGTGTGKSFATIIPAILSGKRVIISTATKALQDQLAYKDIPFLQENLGVPFTFAILKGRNNYLCLNRLSESDTRQELLTRILETVDKRKDDDTFTGEKDQFDFEITSMEWSSIGSEADECGDCGFECYAQRAKAIAQESQIVVVNHALYLTDLIVRIKSQGFAIFLGHHDVVIFDEAHNLEQYAASSLTDRITLPGIENAMGQVTRVTGNYDRNRSGQAKDLTSDAVIAAKALWAVLAPGRIRANDLIEHADLYVDLSNALYEVAEFMAEKWPKTSSDSAKKRGARARRTVENLLQGMQSVITDDFAETLRYVEERTTFKKGLKRLDLIRSPIDIAPYLRRNLFDNGPTCILVSATMTTAKGGFDYVSGRLGVDEFDSLDVGTPFDYASQALLYVPKDLPHPSQEPAAWSSLAIQEMRSLIALSEGRALLLFTSIKEMKSAHAVISQMVPYTCLIQFEEDNKTLARKFREDNHSILFATRSFMEGVDFQGETLSLVVVNKMPFPVPTEPITEARCEQIASRGGDPFNDYSIPVMTLVLKQAVGRLIRNKTDRGVYAILDPRLLKGYGKRIMRALPEAPLATSLDEVEKMFA